MSLLVIDKKTNSKRKKKFTKISSSDPNVVLLYSEKINSINEAEILEAKNNLKNVSESKLVTEPEKSVKENVVNVDAVNNERNLKGTSESIDVEDKETIQENDQGGVDFDFADPNTTSECFARFS